MATISLSPTPAPLSVMSSRRAPLTSNPNVVNSPLRGAAALAGYAKQKRSYATIQREEAYGQPPPMKKQVLENGCQRPIRSPSKVPVPRAQVLVQRVSATATTTRSTTAAVKDRVSRATAAHPTVRANQDVENEKEAWKKHYRAKFPKMVFYFESIPDDVRAKLTKRVTYFGARQEPFFSIDVTHVITTRAIPPERAAADVDGFSGTASTKHDQLQHSRQQQTADDQPQTINPSLLDRNTAARRKLLFDFRHAPVSSQQADETTRRSSNSGKLRNNDVLHKAREMGKKIWSLDKFQTMLAVLLESESHNGGTHTSRSMTMRTQQGTFKSSHEPNLLQLLHNERIHGPSDRDPTAVSRELEYFKGPYIYVWDMDEKQKPIMVRDYPKVANKTDGEWPQFRSVGNGRCPFVEEADPVTEKDYRKTREREKARAIAAAAAAAARREQCAVLHSKPLEAVSVAKSMTGKRTLAEMEDVERNQAAGRAASPTATPGPSSVKGPVMSKGIETAPMQNAFISRATGAGRLLGGEPVASGMQPSNITSAIRSQMISSTSGINGAKAGTSKEVHGLQRKVLQKATTPASHDTSSRRLADISVDVASSRSTNIGRQTSRTTHAHDDDSHSQRAATAVIEGKERKLRSQQTLKSKKDLKPGYCENCQDKFRDFDEHIASRKHRKFAENDDNWTELDLLLTQLKRLPKHFVGPRSECDDPW